MLKPKEQKLIKVEALFIDEISGLAIIKSTGQENTKHNNAQIKIHTKFSYIRYN